MKRLIATRSDETQTDMAILTHPLLKSYAERCGADFKVIEDCKGLHKHYRIMQFYDLFEEYDSILSVDTDILISNKCPNIFEVVPENHIASIYEDVGSRQEDRRKRITLVQKQFGDVGWKTGYINTGFALFPKSSREIFKPVSEENLWLGLGFDDVYLGYQIHKMNIPIYELPIEYNFMSMFTENWCGKSRADAFVTHYAGQGGFIPILERVGLMKDDLLTMRKYGQV